MSSFIEDFQDEAGKFEDPKDKNCSSPHKFRIKHYAKEKARQQLAISNDSPFLLQPNNSEAREVDNTYLEEGKVSLEQISKQLEFFKNRLDALKLSQNNDQSNKRTSEELSHWRHQQSNIHCDNKVSEEDLITHCLKSPNTALPSPRSNNKQQQRYQTRRTFKSSFSKQSEPKYRPLTGKADCPNCNCDRRSSVCDHCIGIALVKPITNEKNEITNSLRSSASNLAANSGAQVRSVYEDERPIRPFKDRTLANGEVVYDDCVVPNKMFTICKSYDDRRTKLAQAIEDLQLKIHQVEEKGNKLDQERKLVQLYKDQWRYGPSIGGPSASSRDRLGNGTKQRNYESRLDPNLRRDSKSLMGFGDIEPVMKLRQYKPVPSIRSRVKPAIRQSTNKIELHTRTKSLESLKSTPSKANPNLQKAIANFQNGKPSSEINLATNTNSNTDVPNSQQINNEDDEIEEVNGEAIKVSPTNSLANVNDEDESEIRPEINNDSGNRQHSDKRVQRMTWIPVFGETEIKPALKKVPKRKLSVVRPVKDDLNSRYSKTYGRPSNQPKNQASQLEDNNRLRRNILRPKTILRSGDSNFCNTNKSSNSTNKNDNQFMNQARRQLKFATDLLEQENSNNGSESNQLFVKKTPTPKPRQNTQLKQSSSLNINKDGTQIKGLEQDSTFAKSSAIDTIKEIARLEEMVNEQQKMLEIMVKSQSEHRHLLVHSPLSISCTSPCCCATCQADLEQITSVHQHDHSRQVISAHSKALIHNLKDKLNKTKSRLARTLEEEREKHQQLKLKVDSSLRKQSDLATENELLKQSLSKCIDTCLKDISNTFESLSDTLTNSFQSHQHDQKQDDDNDDYSTSAGSVLTNAAQLISDNNHLKQMRRTIETIEQQRRGIFEELSKEKQKTNQLEIDLKESQADLAQLLSAKQKLESQLALVSSQKHDLEQERNNASMSSYSDLPAQQQDNSNLNHDDVTDSQPSTQSRETAAKQAWSNSFSETIDKSVSEENTLSSVDLYRRYIQSMSPDIESLKRERKQILNEFDNIKKMLVEMDK